jgi:hypothetical protein
VRDADEITVLNLKPEQIMDRVRDPVPDELSRAAAAAGV